MNVQEAVQRYPLQWPTGWIRTPGYSRKRAAFRTSRTETGRVGVPEGIRRLEREIERMGGENATLSSNMRVRIDGSVRANEGEPGDPGVALYFAFKGKATVFACDRFDRVGDNIAAIAGHIDALRRVERYGVGSLEQALSGYKALPADTAANWRAVFGFGADQRVTLAMLDDAYKTLAKTKHPDLGGSDEAMSHVNRARDFARLEVRS